MTRRDPRAWYSVQGELPLLELDRRPTIPTCPGCKRPGCKRPAHASESDDDDYHAECRS